MRYFLHYPYFFISLPHSKNLVQNYHGPQASAGNSCFSGMAPWVSSIFPAFLFTPVGLFSVYFGTQEGPGFRTKLVPETLRSQVRALIPVSSLSFMEAVLFTGKKINFWPHFLNGASVMRCNDIFLFFYFF